ncbi:MULTISPECIES: recombinase family protein [Streptomyces]|uniref:recombinase family protein n=1 Tax=Streptomyces TaxID=1883 RepID=UPI001CCA0329|nr:MULTISPECIES: recombinase family protein [Streptomyces]UBI37814.1 recombinase family protein [Streptomyces mobaraensis]UKW30401.1 recombinase family protein [Streptomyces sp. TYQ1024]
MTSRDEKISKLRGTPEGLPSVEEVRTMLAADPTLKCVVCYARISFDGRVKDAHGVEDQHRDMSEDARKFNWLVVYRYTDNDKSASKETVVRDDFEQLINDLTVGTTPEGYPIHGVMAANEDRLYRRPSDWERYLKAFTAHGDRVYHDSNGVQDLYAEGFEIKGLVGVAMSLSETRKKQRRTRNSHRSRALRGQPVAAWRPFGWQDDKVTLDPVESEAIRQAVKDVLAGASISEITRRWKEAEYRTSRGNLFQYQTVKQVLVNPRLCGYRELKGQLVRDGDDQPIVGAWEAIITPKQWYAITAKIRERGQGTGLPRGGLVHKYLLTGIMRCGNVLEDGTICNSKMIGVKANDWLKYKHAYFCKKTVDGGCNKTYKRGDKSDEHIERLVIAKLKAEAEAAREEVPEWPRADDLERAVQSRNALEQRWQKGEIDDEAFFRNLAPLEARVKQLRAEQAHHLAMKAEAEAAREDITASWGDKTLTQKRTAIKKVLHAVIAVPGGKGNKTFDVELLKPVWRTA